ncbi:MAG: GUN4 domain-containing protein [Cyanobacteria bacterium P01_F01_bin.150]
MGNGDTIDARASEGFVNKAQSVEVYKGDHTSIDSGGGDVAQGNVDKRQGVFIENLILGSEDIETLRSLLPYSNRLAVDPTALEISRQQRDELRQQKDNFEEKLSGEQELERSVEVDDKIVSQPKIGEAASEDATTRGIFSKLASNGLDNASLVSCEPKLDFKPLIHFLENEQWRDADSETYQLLLLLAERTEENWLRVKDVDKLPTESLKKMDRIWNSHSGGKFGFTVQKNIWNTANKEKYQIVKGRPFDEFQQLVGWAKGSYTPMEYSEFTFSQGAVQGHFPTFGRDRRAYTDWKASFSKFLIHLCEQL